MVQVYYSLERDGRCLYGSEPIVDIGTELILYRDEVYDLCDFPEDEDIFLDIQTFSEPVCSQEDLIGLKSSSPQQSLEECCGAQVFSNVEECPDVQGFRS